MGLIDAGIDLIDLSGFNKCGALHIAAMYGHQQIVTKLLAAGAQVDMQDKNV